MTSSTDTTAEQLPDVDGLMYGCEDAESRNYDWSRGYGENWTSYEGIEVTCADQSEPGTVECDQCDDGRVEKHDGTDDTDPCPDCLGHGVKGCTFSGTVVVTSGSWECPECETDHDCDSADGPMMNYYYPLPDYQIDTDDAAKLAHLPLCLVNFHGSSFDEDDDGEERPTYALALTGGGMDLSWQIAEAHMRLGYMPPAFTCRLPRYAGKDLTAPVAAWVIEGCRRTGRALMERGQRVIDELDRLTAD